MSGMCSGRVVVVTGAGRGIGRAHALLFAREGASVVVNDLGGEVDGSGHPSGPAQEVVDEIRAGGGEAVVNSDDVADLQGAKRLIDTAVESFGRLDVLVNNAGILRDRMVTNMTEAEWDAVIRVNLRGTFAPTWWAAAYWCERARSGETNDARVINMSASGLYANAGQTNYNAAKAGIASFTTIAAKELGRYGVTVNAVAPGARTRMSAPVGFGEGPNDGKFDAFAPENISPLVVWLGSPMSREVTGRVFDVAGGRISVADGWCPGPEADKGDRWEPAELSEVVPDLVARTAAPTELFA